MSENDEATPQGVLGHGLTGPPLLDPADVREGQDRGDGTLGTLVPDPGVVDASGPLAEEIRDIVDSAYRNTLIDGLNIGSAVILTRAASGVYDPATGTITGGSTYETRRAIPRDYTIAEIARSGGLLNQDSREFRILHDENNAAPRSGDTVTLEGVTLRIERVQTKYLDGQPLQYVCQCGK